MKKSRFSLKKRTFNSIMPLLAVAVILAGFCMAPMKVCAATDPKAELSRSGVGWLYYNEGEDAAFNYLKEHSSSISSDLIQQSINNGMFPNHIEELKELYPNVDYSAVSGSSSTPAQTENTEPAPAPEPATFTVEDMEDTPMWAIQIVNYREGASTEYAKLGSLSQYEQVIVNGVASTGWYRFITSDGSTAYVSNSYLTTEDPSNRELNIYNEETGHVDTYAFEDTEPEVIDEVIESIKEEYEEKETVAVEPAPEPEPEEVITVEEEPEIEEEAIVEEESSAYSWKFYVSCVFAVVCVIIIGIGIWNKGRQVRN